jgi:hypothetical protein
LADQERDELPSPDTGAGLRVMVDDAAMVGDRDDVDGLDRRLELDGAEPVHRGTGRQAAQVIEFDLAADGDRAHVG